MSFRRVPSTWLSYSAGAEAVQQSDGVTPPGDRRRHWGSPARIELPLGAVLNPQAPALRFGCRAGNRQSEPDAWTVFFSRWYLVKIRSRASAGTPGPASLTVRRRSRPAT